jgi:mevalonate kinase
MSDGSPAVIPLRLLACGEAPAKLILLGEHFVVHGVSALALPLPLLGTHIAVHENPALDHVALDTSGPPADATALRVLDRALALLALPASLPWRLAVRSTIPMGHGLGSSASFAVALVRALAAAARVELSSAALRAHAHTLEQITHGTPSGIDDTVVALGVPISFRRGGAIERLEAHHALRFVLASAGGPGATAEAVARVHALQQQHPARFARLCAEAEQTTAAGLRAFRAGAATELGRRMTANHALLQQLDVSTPTLDRLVAAACAAGAHGAKLTGAGRGGFIVALVERDTEAAVRTTLDAAGAPRTFTFATGTLATGERPLGTAEQPR